MDPGNAYRRYSSRLKKLYNGEMTSEEFAELFDLFEEDARYPSVGVFIVVRFPYLVLRCAGPRAWMRAAGTLAFMDKVRRGQFELAMQPARTYSNNDVATAVLLENKQLHKIMVRAMLMFLGFQRARNWERITGFGGELGLEFCLEGGELSLGHIILDHLKEGSVDDIRLLMGGNPEGTEFDGSNLILALGKYLRAGAAVCAVRAPELFLYRGRCFGLDEAHLNVLCLLVRENAGTSLRDDQKVELVSGDFMPADARDSFRRSWRL